MKIKIFVFLILFFISCFSLTAWDFGILVEQNIETNSNTSSDSIGFNYSGIFIPYYSSLLGENGEFYISAGFNYNTDPFNYIPELLRTEFTMRFGAAELKLGRIPYRDPLGMVAEGLFDGAQFSYDTLLGTLSAGAWYTGFLYKKSAAIEMTYNELQHNYRDVDYDNFYDTYFAPRRMFSSLRWEHPSLGGLLNAKLDILGQFDLSGADLNTQYFSARLAMPSRIVVLDLGGVFGLAQNEEDFGVFFAADTGLTFMFPTVLENHITLRGRFSSGVIQDSIIGSFLPLTTIQYGELLKAKLSALSVLSFNYRSRFNRILFADLGASYFVRSDLGTYKEYPVIGIDSNGYFLGAEVYAGTFWALSSEIQMKLGGGMFLPSLGDAAPDADMLWRVELNFLISLF